jgi:hypothetical protein
MKKHHMLDYALAGNEDDCSEDYVFYLASDVDREILQRDQRIACLERDLEETERARRRLACALTPRYWTKTQRDDWHRSIPDTEKAFSALRKSVSEE